MVVRVEGWDFDRVTAKVMLQAPVKVLGEQVLEE